MMNRQQGEALAARAVAEGAVRAEIRESGSGGNSVTVIGEDQHGPFTLKDANDWNSRQNLRLSDDTRGAA